MLVPYTCGSIEACVIFLGLESGNSLSFPFVFLEKMYTLLIAYCVCSQGRRALQEVIP